LELFYRHKLNHKLYMSQSRGILGLSPGNTLENSPTTGIFSNSGNFLVFKVCNIGQLSMDGNMVPFWPEACWSSIALGRLMITPSLHWLWMKRLYILASQPVIWIMLVFKINYLSYFFFFYFGKKQLEKSCAINIYIPWRTWNCLKPVDEMICWVVYFCQCVCAAYFEDIVDTSWRPVFPLP